MTKTNPTKRRRFRFSLRTLMAVMVLLSFGLGWMGTVLRQIRREKEILRRFDKCYTSADYRLGYVVGLSVGNPPFEAPIGPNDADLVHLRGFAKLELLSVCSSNVTDDGLSSIREITSLECLYLFHTGITDSELASLQDLPDLVELAIENAEVTNDGLERLASLTDLEMLGVMDNHVTDDGLWCLRGLTKLRVLDLRGTQVTADGVKKLRGSLPNCEICY